MKRERKWRKRKGNQEKYPPHENKTGKIATKPAQAQLHPDPPPITPTTPSELAAVDDAAAPDELVVLPPLDEVACLDDDGDEAPVPVDVALDVDGVNEDAGLVERESEAVLESVSVDIGAGDVADERVVGIGREDVREATGEDQEPDIPSRLMRSNRAGG